jgi:hypothetical protein
MLNKTFIDKNDTAPVFQTRCYVLNGLTYVPHYSLQGQYVRPGYVNATPFTDISAEPFAMRDSKRITLTVSELYLISAKARVVTEMLWSRSREWISSIQHSNND